MFEFIYRAHFVLGLSFKTSTIFHRSSLCKTVFLSLLTHLSNQERALFVRFRTSHWHTHEGVTSSISVFPLPGKHKAITATPVRPCHKPLTYSWRSYHSSQFSPYLRNAERSHSQLLLYIWLFIQFIKINWNTCQKVTEFINRQEIVSISERSPAFRRLNEATEKDKNVLPVYLDLFLTWGTASNRRYSLGIC